MHSITGPRLWATALLAGLALGSSATAAPIETTYSTIDLIAEQTTLPADGAR